MTNPTTPQTLTGRLFRRFGPADDADPRTRLPGHAADINPSVRTGYIDTGEALAGDAIENDPELEQVVDDLARSLADGEGCEAWDPDTLPADGLRDADHQRDLERRDDLDARRSALEATRFAAEEALDAADPVPAKPWVPLWAPALTSLATAFVVFLTVQTMLGDVLWGRELIAVAGGCSLVIGMAVTVPLIALARNEASPTAFRIALAAGLSFALLVFAARYALAEDISALPYSLFALAIEGASVVLNEQVLAAWKDRLVRWRRIRDHHRNLRRRIDEADAALDRLRSEIAEVEDRIAGHQALVDTRTHGALAREVLYRGVRHHLRFGLVSRLRENFHRLIGAPRATHDQIIPLERTRA